MIFWKSAAEHYSQNKHFGLLRRNNYLDKLNGTVVPGNPKFFNLKDIIVDVLGVTTVFTGTRILVLKWLISLLA